MMGQEHDKNGKLGSYYIESNFDKVSNEPERTELYGNNGELIYINGSYHDSNGKALFTYDAGDEIDNIAVKIYSQRENLTEESLNQLLFKINQMSINKSSR